jgi:hypothetical protein
MIHYFKPFVILEKLQVAFLTGEYQLLFFISILALFPNNPEALGLG